MFGLSMTELLVVLAVALLVIGPKQLPQLAKTLGKTLRDVRRATDDLRDTFEREVMEETRPKIRPDPSSVAARSPMLTDSGESTPNRALTANAPPAPLGHPVPSTAPEAARPASGGSATSTESGTAHASAGDRSDEAIASTPAGNGDTKTSGGAA